MFLLGHVYVLYVSNCVAKGKYRTLIQKYTLGKNVTRSHDFYTFVIIDENKSIDT